MSPRSAELMNEARARLRAAGLLLDGGLPSAAVTDANYAMLYAARAALSELDRHAKAHSGAWDQGHPRFVASGRFGDALARETRRVQRFRKGAGYEALLVDAEGAARIADLAERFVAAVDDMLTADP